VPCRPLLLELLELDDLPELDLLAPELPVPEPLELVPELCWADVACADPGRV